mgnify:CR=1 FL=1
MKPINARLAITPKRRCAVYTRKSTDEGLDQEYNSLEAQRDAALAFISSQRHEGWIAIDDGYDDGGFSGGNTNRPALKRLLSDVEDCRIDVVVVYKIDRIARSLKDLLAQRAALEQQISETQERERADAIGKVKSLMQEYGLTVADLTARAAKTGAGASYEAYVDGQVSNSIWSPPLAIPYALMAAGMTLLCLQIAVQIVNSFGRAKRA